MEKKQENATLWGIVVLHSNRIVYQKLPKILVICLNWAVCSTKTTVKLTTAANLFSETDIENGQNKKMSGYKLVSGVCHMGTSSQSEHYVCYDIKSNETVHI